MNRRPAPHNGAQLTVAEPYCDRVAAGEDCTRDERRQHDSLAVSGHGKTLRSDRMATAGSLAFCQCAQVRAQILLAMPWEAAPPRALVVSGATARC